MKNVSLRTGTGGLVRLGDIAAVDDGIAVPQWLLVNDNGQPAVTFDVFQQDSANSVSLAKEVKTRLDAFMKTQSKAIICSNGMTRRNWSIPRSRRSRRRS